MSSKQYARPAEVWWLKPIWPFCGMAALVAVLAALVPASTFEQSWNTPKYFDEKILLYIFASIAAFALGTLVTRTAVLSRDPSPVFSANRELPWATALLLFRLSFLLCLFGYAMWAYSAVKNGVSLQLVFGALTGAKGATYELRETYLTTISGVTTMTQFGIAAIALGLPIGYTRGWKTVRIPMAIVVLLAVFRAVVNSERLAVIELVTPILVTSIAYRYLRNRRSTRIVSLAPIAGPVLVLFVFTVFEYSRSWAAFYSGGDKTLLQFTSDRLLGYYVTALNNTAYIWRETQIPLGAPFFTMNFLWRFPLIGDFIHDFFHGVAFGTPSHYMNLLANGANPEFNNTGGILLPLIDFGVSYGLMFWLIFGAAMQAMYEAYVRGSPAGLLMYPAMYVGLLEIPRIFYWSDARFFPAFCMLVIGCFLLSMPTRKELVLGWKRRKGDNLATT